MCREVSPSFDRLSERTPNSSWIILLIGAVFLLNSIWPQPSMAANTCVDWKRLDDGEIIIVPTANEDNIPGLCASFKVSATKEHIWATLVDYPNFPRFFSGIKKIEVLEENQSGAKVEFWVDAVLDELHYVFNREYQVQEQRLTWKKLSGDLKRIEGSWEIIDTPNPDRKIVVYESYVEVGTLIPTRLIRWGAMRKARDMCERLRAWIEDENPKK
jgi:ribosome-associated toxin RatA of RatAB toxin-antitoxin module